MLKSKKKKMKRNLKKMKITSNKSFNCKKTCKTFKNFKMKFYPVKSILIQFVKNKCTTFMKTSKSSLRYPPIQPKRKFNIQIVTSALIYIVSNATSKILTRKLELKGTSQLKGSNLRRMIIQIQMRILMCFCSKMFMMCFSRSIKIY